MAAPNRYRKALPCTTPPLNLRRIYLWVYIDPFDSGGGLRRLPILPQREPMLPSLPSGTKVPCTLSLVRCPGKHPVNTAGSRTPWACGAKLAAL